jgi:hypothetical protein
LNEGPCGKDPSFGIVGHGERSLKVSLKIREVVIADLGPLEQAGEVRLARDDVTVAVAVAVTVTVTEGGRGSARRGCGVDPRIRDLGVRLCRGLARDDEGDRTERDFERNAPEVAKIEWDLPSIHRRRVTYESRLSRL